MNTYRICIWLDSKGCVCPPSVTAFSSEDTLNILKQEHGANLRYWLITNQADPSDQRRHLPSEIREPHPL